jgi:hypothetical protein
MPFAPLRDRKLGKFEPGENYWQGEHHAFDPTRSTI